jgi:hypothetical protein
MARLLNRCWAAIYARGVAPNYLVALEVVGRQSGRTIRLPLVMVVVEGERYLVSMLGADVNWVRNVQAAGGTSPSFTVGARRCIWKKSRPRVVREC